MVSETAHDIRSPLTTIRESVRLVHDGELGAINAQQQHYLAAAVDQCNCLDQLVSELVQLERLRTGLPRARRGWVSVTNVRDTIDETLRPWALPRAIRILWDGADDPDVKIFADLAMIRRLVVNLVSNAIRVTAEGESVLIRIEPTRQGNALRWTVVDQGPGISSADLKEITEHRVSLGGGEGLGLTICRQLSALHFSNLQIESRVGTGTAVSFETATGGPGSVAESWARWRVKQRLPLQRPARRDAGSGNENNLRLPGQIRIDNPATVIELSGEGSEPEFDNRIAAGSVHLGAAMPSQAAEAFDVILQNHLRMFDFVYRIDARNWVWVFDADQSAAEQRIDEIKKIADQQIDNLRLSWSQPQTIPLDQHRTAARLSDLLVRHALSAAKTPIVENPEVVPGAPLPQSPVATERLEEELRRLSQRLNLQSEQIAKQAVRMRPTKA
jgi:anti-sigma regulatory factor (Ser/Thr protein kinase)